MDNDFKIISKLCATYNTSLLDKLSPETIKILKSMLLKGEEEEKEGFAGLIHIIKNHLELPLGRPVKRELPIQTSFDYIRGPMTLTVHRSKKYGKYIYVFGENHMIYNECLKNKNSTTVEDFLATNIDKSDKFIDLLIEMQYINKKGWKIRRGSSHIDDINDKFGIGCTGLKKECKYLNLRYHYVDVRSSPAASELIKSVDNFHNLARTTPSRIESELYVIIDHLEILLKAPFKNNKELADLLEKDFYSLKIEKQLKKMDPDVKKLLIEYHNKIHMKMMKEIESFDVRTIVVQLLEIFTHIDRSDDQLETITESHTRLSELFDKLGIVFTKSLSFLYMDMYMLSRIFRGFTPVKNMNSLPPKYIVMYSGNAHSDNYRKFLTEIGFEKIYDKRTSNYTDNCLDIKDLPQPLFPEYMA